MMMLRLLLVILGLSWVNWLVIFPAIAETEKEVEVQTVILSRLRGRWQAKDPTTGQLIELIFADDDQLYIVSPVANGSTEAVEMGYRVDETVNPMHLDLAVTPTSIAYTLFEFTEDGKLRLELASITPGNNRPANFSDSATLFTKVASTATVPTESLRLTTSAEQQAKVPIQYASILLKAQREFYSQHGRFAADLAELALAGNLETEFYAYEMEMRDEAAAIVTARAKNAELPSYTGVVFATGDDSITIAGICRTDNPSTSPPQMPSLSDRQQEVVCPAGSSLLR